MINYPENFPLPTTSLDSEVETPVVRTSLDTGLLEQESRFSTAKRTTRTTWKLSAAELLVFENWFADDLVGGCLVFGMTLVNDGVVGVVPVRFVAGGYSVSHDGGLWFSVSATVEQMLVAIAPANRTPPVPIWARLNVDPAISQVLTLSHRNARLVTRPTAENTTTLRVFPPISKASWIYFGVAPLGAGEVLITSQDVDSIPSEPAISFPIELPGVNSSFGFSASRPNSRLEMESGHARQWAFFDTASKTYQVSWELSLLELGIFQDFFFTTLNSGTKQFALTLAVDGGYAPVLVRFVGGQYAETYVGVNRFVVSATIERVISQTETPETERPYPVIYSPAVDVYTNRKVTAADAFKMFNVYPEAGQTINLHIYSGTFEFGVTVKGLGNVLITRGPFVLDLGAFTPDTGAGVFDKPVFALEATILDMGTLALDQGSGTFGKPVLELVSVVENLGTLGGQTGAGTFKTPVFEVLDVLVDLGTLEQQTGSGTFRQPLFELTTP